MNSRLLPTIFLLLMVSPRIAQAGTDDMHVVTKLTGLVEARTVHRYGKRVSFGSWKKIHLHDLLDSGVEVRSAPHASVWLQTGDHVENPNKLPADVRISYYVLAPSSAVRLNTQGRNLALVQKLHGHVTLRTRRGKVANGTYYKHMH